MSNLFKNTNVTSIKINNDSNSIGLSQFCFGGINNIQILSDSIWISENSLSVNTNKNVSISLYAMSITMDGNNCFSGNYSSFLLNLQASNIEITNGMQPLSGINSESFNMSVSNEQKNKEIIKNSGLTPEQYNKVVYV